MAERPQGPVRAIDVVLVPLRATARRLVPVVERHLADVTRHGDRQLAARARRRRTGRPRSRPGRPHRAPRHAGPLPPGAASSGMDSGRPATRTMTTGVPVAATAAEQLALAARQAELQPVACLAARASRREARPLAEHEHGHIRASGRFDRRRDVLALVRPGCRTRARSGPASLPGLARRSRGGPSSTPASSSASWRCSGAADPATPSRPRFSSSVSMCTMWP